MVDTVEALVDGGKATAGPPLGPALGPKGVNIGQIIAKINEKTKAFEGMKVPVKILINPDKSFDIKVGTPPVSALIKNELGLETASGNPKTTVVGNLTVEQIKKIAEMKQDSLLGATERARVSEVAGNCVSCGVTVDGKDPKVFQKDLKAGVYDAQIAH
ncbi:50S ribosomal protein L11 [Candidatus Methanomethylophilus sp. 1R26]|jgi:large subunit ribosomal protein L11|uniref:50S ribosomal protein L11 n=1 Tax=Candidatus Methanomethylophilus sp. 1R26 TaxID=1769296 RepID=UPI000735E83D|nr:50S ribosomal protein L11 [Candidatus Methanomethylophilus sp. 1R26]KUE73401.1 50S ribosomal protein L11 [Candidatus Methanomethylophilus sp. 1R26]MEE3400385.1 50S ribosomal protein L11 [Methanomethylophilus sp.]TQS80837.1 MAG: 50S ribosomal protein L11 [Methanomethylophilus alvi]WII08570.1 50S ribosomal protein L11 [Methanomassiliicoccales archaeon LGM-DZ1]